MSDDIREGRIDIDKVDEVEEGKSKYLKVSDVARTLNVSPMTIYRQIKAGKLRALRVGNSMRIHEKDLESYLHQETSGALSTAGSNTGIGESA